MIKHSRNKFTPEEDKQLMNLVEIYGTDNWYLISKQMKGRKTRQCKERWMFYLNPKINKGAWAQEEDDLIQEKYMELGPCWKIIATFLEGRTEVSVKNRWNKIMRKRNRNIVNIDNKKQNPISTERPENSKSVNFDDIDLNIFSPTMNPFEFNIRDVDFDSFF